MKLWLSFTPHRPEFLSLTAMAIMIQPSSVMKRQSPSVKWLCWRKDFGIPQWESNNNEPVRVRLTTQYVIEGSASFDIEVL